MQTPRAQAEADCETERAPREVCTDDARGRGYRPHALKQRLQERPVESVQSTPAEGVTGPSHSSSDRLRTLTERPAGRYRRRARKGVQAPRAQAEADCSTELTSREVGKDDARGRGYMPHALK